MKHYEYIESDDCYDMAVEWLRHRNFEKAVEYFNRAIELNPYFIYAYISLARAYATKGKFNESIHALKRASRIDTAFDRLPYLMARYAFKNGDYKSALAFIHRAIELDEKPLYLRAREFFEESYRSRQHA